jgi:hypothetical protein
MRLRLPSLNSPVALQRLLLGVAIAIALFFGLWKLPHSPATWFDEGINVGIAQSLVTKGVYSLQVAPDSYVNERSFLITSNFPVLLPVAASLRLLGNSLLAARLPQVLFLVLFVVLAYQWVRQTYALPAAAFFSALLVITFAPFYGNGKAVLGEVPGLVYFLSGLLLISSRRQLWRAALAGLFFGLSAATKPFFLIVVPALAAGELWEARVLRVWPWKRWLVMACAGAVPLVFWLTTIITPFSLGGIGAAVGYYTNSYAASDFISLIARNLFRFVSESTPVHFLLLCTVAAYGLWKRLREKKLTKSEIILAVFIGINTIWYLKTPGWYRYFFTAHLAAFLFCPAILLTYIKKQKIALALIGALIVFQSAHLITKRADELYYSRYAEDAAMVIKASAHAGDSMLIINAPSLAFLLSDYPVYQYLKINPKLHFGGAPEYDQSGRPFPYIILANSDALDEIPGLANRLARQYGLIASRGHYNIYHYRL